jgi:hypothetical protein
MAMWPDDNQHGAPIDTAIDEAARQMTVGVPGGDFRARVLARIGEREPASGRWRLAWLLAPVAAAVIVFFVVVGQSADSRNRGESPVTRPHPTETARRQPEPTTTTAAAPPQTRQAPAPVRPKPDTTYARSGSGPRPGGAPLIAPSEVDALVPALDVESIRLAALPPADSIRVTPLDTIEPIDVAPLAAPETDESHRRQR